MSEKTAGYSVTHKPLGKGKRNGPWGTGQLPAYIQNVADGIRDGGKPLGQAIQIAMGKVRGWARGEGNVSAEVRAAAKKAVAELDALLAKTKGKKLVEAADVVGAVGRLDMLDRLGLPVAGQGAQDDLLTVAASDAPLVEATIAEVAKRRKEAQRGVSDAEFEKLHPRGGGGKFVRSGSSGREVRAIQRRVGARVDGDFGSQTKAKVMAYQRRKGLTVDGVVGRQTLAAMRGRKDAKRVKVGALSKGDREWLRGHVRSDGGSRRVVEAVAVGSLLDRVQQLEPGEHARLPDGGAVRHSHTIDGRKVWTAASPSRWGDGDGLSWATPRDTPEEAVADALSDSAGRTHPDSLGGASRWGRYTSVYVNGRPAEFRGVSATGQPLVIIDGAPSREPTATSWTALVPRSRLVEAGSPRSHGGEPTHNHPARSHRKDAKVGAGKISAAEREALQDIANGGLPPGGLIGIRDYRRKGWIDTELNLTPLGRKALGGKAAPAKAAEPAKVAKPIGRGSGPKEERAQLKTKIANLDVGKSMTVGDRKVERVAMAQWKVDGRSFMSAEEALTAVYAPKRR